MFKKKIIITIGINSNLNADERKKMIENATKCLEHKGFKACVFSVPANSGVLTHGEIRVDYVER